MVMAKSPKITVVLPDEDKSQLEKIAADEGRTISNLVARILHQWLTENIQLTDK
ncbi:MAG: ribbon-helix-helix protein, CopG family [Aulosira sp. DedQUE10]|nr:ribbon-helix-helix protein, CopG family [Aulosira sp. DedQUE10]